MDHKNKFKNKARVIKHVLQVLKLSKDRIPPTLVTSCEYYEGHKKV